MRCFSSPGSLPLEGMTELTLRRVAPFGHLGINACVPLPRAYRSLPRPSSPPCAQAFPTCLHSLDSNSFSNLIRAIYTSETIQSELHHYGVWIHSACALLGAHAGFPQSCCPSVVKQRSQVPERAPGQKKKTGLSAVVVRAGDTRALSVPRDLLASSVKEVIQPQVPLRLPCYDFAPVTRLAFGGLLPCGLRHRLRALRASMA